MTTRAVAAVADALRHAAARLPDVLAPGARLVVGYSGGQDSTCLLHALAQRGSSLGLDLDLDLVAAHVDHGLRAESAAQAVEVAEIARSFGVVCQVRRIDLPAYQARTGWGIQQAARAARYQVLASVVAECQAQALLVAHTADDQAETLLLNLLRGAGLRGLAGMRLDERLDAAQLGPPLPLGEALSRGEGAAQADTPPSPGSLRSPTSPRGRGMVRVARPLLRISRATTLAYCQELGLARVADPSNESGVYTRNRVRLELLPLLERFNPAVRTVLARTADLAAEDEQALDDLANARLAELATAADPDALEIDLAAWRRQPRALQRRLLRLGLARLLGGLVDVPDAPIEDALDLLAATRGKRAYHLPGGVELVASQQCFILRLHGQARPPKRSKSWGIGPPRL